MGAMTLKTTDAAKAFVREFKLPAGYLSGSSFWTHDEWMKRVDYLSRGKTAAQVAAVVMRTGKRHAKAATFDGVFCQCCGTRLSAPESVAAGVGPKCQAR